MYASESKCNVIFSLFEDMFEKYLSGYILLKTKKIHLEPFYFLYYNILLLISVFIIYIFP